MTAAELIQILETLPQDTEVFTLVEYDGAGTPYYNHVVQLVLPGNWDAGERAESGLPDHDNFVVLFT
jgi:hypothetical protein